MLRNVHVRVPWPVVCVNANMDSEYCCHGVSCVFVVVVFLLLWLCSMLCCVSYTSSYHTIYLPVLVLRVGVHQETTPTRHARMARTVCRVLEMGNVSVDSADVHNW